MSLNVANQITDIALQYPHKRSVVMPVKSFFSSSYSYKHLTFIELEGRINRFCHRLLRLGVKRGDKVLLFVKPSIDFSVLTFALFKIGATPILIDPGMGVKNFLNAVEGVGADVLLGIPKAHLLSRIFYKKFKSIRLYLNTSSFALFSKSITRSLNKEVALFEATDMSEDEMAAILFTSGGTGIPKGVVYTHSIFIEQTKMLQREFNLTDEDIDIPGFPLFALFTLSMGMTSCIPDMDPSKPGKSDPKKLLENIKDQGATFVAGSPAIWKNLADHCLKNRITLPSVKYLVMFGAPIPVELHQKFKKILPFGTTFTPYGATECLPVSNTSGKEVLTETAQETLSGKGTCIGLPFSGVDIKIIKNSFDPIENISGVIELPNYEIGEIIVQSKSVTPGYLNMPKKTALAKIGDDKGLWHRMGDMGYKDVKGQVWFCGRQSHAFKFNDKSFYPITIENVINQHPEIDKSALVKKDGIGPVLILQRKDKKTAVSLKAHEKLVTELQELTSNIDQAKFIKELIFHESLPVDVRHNIKIDRLKLTQSINQKMDEK